MTNPEHIVVAILSVLNLIGNLMVLFINVKLYNQIKGRQ